MTNDDSTQAGATAFIEAAETQVVANNLAWSQENYTEPSGVRHLDEARRPVSSVLVGVFGAAVVCSGALVAFGVIAHNVHKGEEISSLPTTSVTLAPPSSPPVTTTVTVTPAPITLPPTALPAPSTVPPIAAPAAPAPEQLPPRHHSDDDFLAVISGDGITYDSRAHALQDAHDVCTYLGQGHTADDAVAAGRADNPQLTPMGGYDFVHFSIDYFCPQYN
jgi:Protein of unknown function (DUF732)